MQRSLPIYDARKHPIVHVSAQLAWFNVPGVMDSKEASRITNNASSFFVKRHKIDMLFQNLSVSEF